MCVGSLTALPFVHTRPLCSHMCVACVRHALTLCLWSQAIETDLFEYTISYIKWSYAILEHYAELHLPSKVAVATMTVLRDLIGLAILRMIVTYMQAYRRTTFKEWKATTTERVFRLLKHNVGAVQRELQKEEDKMEASLTEELKDRNRKRTLVLPKKGRTSKSLLADLNKRGKVENKKWQDGLVSGAVYCGEQVSGSRKHGVNKGPTDMA